MAGEGTEERGIVVVMESEQKEEVAGLMIMPYGERRPLRRFLRVVAVLLLLLLEVMEEVVVQRRRKAEEQTGLNHDVSRNTQAIY